MKKSLIVAVAICLAALVWRYEAAVQAQAVAKAAMDNLATEQLKLSRDCSDLAYKFWGRQGRNIFFKYKIANYRSHYNRQRKQCLVEAFANNGEVDTMQTVDAIFDAVEGKAIGTLIMGAPGGSPFYLETGDNEKQEYGGPELQMRFQSEFKSLMEQ